MLYCQQCGKEVTTRSSAVYNGKGEYRHLSCVTNFQVHPLYIQNRIELDDPYPMEDKTLLTNLKKAIPIIEHYGGRVKYISSSEVVLVYPYGFPERLCKYGHMEVVNLYNMLGAFPIKRKLMEELPEKFEPYYVSDRVFNENSKQKKFPTIPKLKFRRK